MTDHRPEPPPHGVILVGVAKDLADAVLIVASRLAADLGCDLVCASVDPNRYAVTEDNDGTVHSVPIDPDLPEFDEDVFDPALTQRIEKLLSGTGVSWSPRTLAGDPARALGHLAEKLDARMIVVGTHEAGLRTSMREFFRSSVAVHLAHRQHRPVLVVPLSPVDDGRALPWE